MPMVNEEDLPLMNALEQEEPPSKAQTVVDLNKWDNFEDAREYDSDNCTIVSDDRSRDSGDPEEERRLHEPDEDGKFHDDPLWFGKTLSDIKFCTNKSKEDGNAAHRAGDTEEAKKHWKSALKGAQKIKDNEAEFRLHLNLAMGYTKLGKASKALKHCDEALRETLRGSVPSALQAKAHFRKAEAYECAGEEANAMASLKAALQIDSTNTEVRRKYEEIRKRELERRQREKALFRGKLFLDAASGDKDDCSDPELKGVDEDGEHSDDDDHGQDTERALDFNVEALTDRAAAQELYDKACHGRGIDFVGERMQLYGPVNSETANAEDPVHEEKGISF